MAGGVLIPNLAGGVVLQEDDGVKKCSVKNKSNELEPDPIGCSCG